LKFTVSEPKPWKRILDIEVPSDVVQGELNSTFRRYQKEIRMPGFRQGKVPLDVLKARYGDEIRAEVIERLIPEYLQQAGKEAEIKPISSPVIENLNFDTGEDLRFRAVIEIKPAIELKDCMGMRLTRRPVNVTGEDINRVIESLRERHANVVRIDDAAQNDHYLVADFQHLDPSGVPIIGRKEEKQLFRLGSGLMGEAFDTGLVGIRSGENRTVKVRYPEDHTDAQLAGQEALFDVHVQEILEKTLPELNDDFAIDIGAENLEALQNSIRQDLEREPDREVRSQLLKQLRETHDFEVPDSMIGHYLDHTLEDARRGSRQPIDEEALRESYRPLAVEQIKQTLLLDAIAQKEQIKVYESEIDERLQRMADRSHLPLDSLKRLFQKNGRIDRIEFDIQEEKVIEFLMQHADIQVE